MLVFKALKFSQPVYLNELFTHYTPMSNAILRSADDIHLLIVPRLKKHSSFASRAISYAGPMYYNKLPFYIKEASTVDCFKKLLKSYLFKKSYDPITKTVTVEYKI